MEISQLKSELERLHEASFGWAVSCCRRDRTLAEEVLQAVYLKILQGKASYEGKTRDGVACQFRTFLFAVIRKTALSERRKSLFRDLTTAVRENTERCSEHLQPDMEFERTEMQKRFLLVLQSLPARQRETLHLVFYQDLSLREAALVMGISIGSARTHYERGKAQLRKQFHREEVHHGVGWRRKENPGAVS
jgi:RNA polymerase sigma-70 factor (ECF subfamily)